MYAITYHLGSDTWGAPKKQNKMRIPEKCKSGIGWSCWASEWLCCHSSQKGFSITKHEETETESQRLFFLPFLDDPTLNFYCDVSLFFLPADILIGLNRLNPPFHLDVFVHFPAAWHRFDHSEPDSTRRVLYVYILDFEKICKYV